MEFFSGFSACAISGVQPQDQVFLAGFAVALILYVEGVDVGFPAVRYPGQIQDSCVLLLWKAVLKIFPKSILKLDLSCHFSRP
jgi:hypothetical protein